MKSWLLILPLAMLVALALLFAVTLKKGAPERRSALLGREAPTFELPAIAGVSTPGLARTDLGKGKPVLVNFWASWCAPCRLEQPVLERLAEHSGLDIVAINYKDEPEAAKAFLARFGNPFARIGADRSGRVAIDWGVAQVPESFYISSDGKIIGHIGGPLDERTAALWAKGRSN